MFGVSSAYQCANLAIPAGQSLNTASRIRPALPRVLVVEPDEGVRRVIARALSAVGCYPVDVSTPDRALNFLSDCGCDAVVINGGPLGHTSGTALAVAIRRRRPRMPLVCIGGQDDTWMGCGLQPDRLTCFIHKPFGVRVVADHVAGMLMLVRGPAGAR